MWRCWQKILIAKFSKKALIKRIYKILLLFWTTEKCIDKDRSDMPFGNICYFSVCIVFNASRYWVGDCNVIFTLSTLYWIIHDSTRKWSFNRSNLKFIFILQFKPQRKSSKTPSNLMYLLCVILFYNWFPVFHFSPMYTRNKIALGKSTN